VDLLSTVSPTMAGGYWDLDNVRLAASIAIPNGSFELPSTTFADPRIDSWQKSPKPDWYDESGGFTWDQLTGVFLNTPPGNATHIDNPDGTQAVFLFAVPQVELSQEAKPGSALDAKFEVGKAYQLTVGVIGGGGGMTNGATLQIGVFYRDSASNRVNVATMVITNSPGLFSTTTHFVDFTLSVPTVKATDPWAGQNIGVDLLSTVSPTMAGGYWDLDNVRLAEAGAPALALSSSRSGSDLRIAWPSEVGAQYQLETSADLRSWSKLDAPLTGTGGELNKSVGTAGAANAFYRILKTTGP
jgi:hypothetical protein